MCNVCFHAHLEGQKCEVCGHIGRTEAMRSLSRPGPTDPNLHFVAEDASTLPPDKLRGHLLLASILRRQVFCDEMELPEGPFEFTDADYMWRHVFAQSTLLSLLLMLCLPSADGEGGAGSCGRASASHRCAARGEPSPSAGVTAVRGCAEGDAPLGYLRWKVEVNPATQRAVAAIFDMLCVTSRARREGIAIRLIGFCISVRCPWPLAVAHPHPSSAFLYEVLCTSRCDN